MTGVGDGDGDGDGEGVGDGLGEVSFCEATGRVNGRQKARNSRHKRATKPEGLAINSHNRKVVELLFTIPQARRAGTGFCRTFGAPVRP